jgi:hypothetical protein
MEAEWQNILRVVKYAIDHEWKAHGVRLAHLMTEFLDTTGRWEEAAATHELALRASRDLGDMREVAHAAAELSLDELRTGNLDGALEHTLQALATYRRLGDTRGEAETLDHVGVVHGPVAQSGSAAYALRRDVRDTSTAVIKLTDAARSSTAENTKGLSGN